MFLLNVSEQGKKKEEPRRAGDNTLRKNCSISLDKRVSLVRKHPTSTAQNYSVKEKRAGDKKERLLEIKNTIESGLEN